MPLLHWDSYWHWVLNGSYLYRFDRFPAEPLDFFPSYHPTYPMASPLIYAFASLLTGAFTPTAGIYTNLLLSLIAMQSVMRLLTELVPATADRFARKPFLWRYALPIVASCLVLALNPSFRSINYFSAIADPGLGVIVLVMLIGWSRYLLGGDKRDLLLLFMLGVLVSGLKNSGWVLVGVLTASGVGVGLLRRIPWRRWLAPAVAACAGALIAQALWQAYLSRHLPLPDQFTVQPFSEWRFDLARGLFAGVLADFKRSFGYYGLILLTTLAGAVFLLKRGRARNERMGLLLGLIAIAMPMHLLSLIAAYLGTGFYVPEILRAASLHRYSSHLGFAACISGMLAVIVWAEPHARRWLTERALTFASMALVGFYVVILGLKILKPSLRAGLDDLEKYAGLRESAAKVAAMLPAGQTVVVFGEQWAVNFANYELWRPSHAGRGATLVANKITQTSADLEAAKQLFQQWKADPSIDHIWLFEDRILNPTLGNPPAFSLIWSRATDSWQVIEQTRKR
jgi:hypothetical protein